MRKLLSVIRYLFSQVVNTTFKRLFMSKAALLLSRLSPVQRITGLGADFGQSMFLAHIPGVVEAFGKNPYKKKSLTIPKTLKGDFIFL